MNKELHMKLKSMPSVIMLMLFLAASFLGSEGTLLCFGNDGHVAIEFLDACNSSGFDSHLEVIESDACGPCKDIQFLGCPAYTRNASHHTQALPLISSSLISPALSLKEYFNKRINPPDYLHDKILASLHSVVLLI
jgi:hypothetical protein